MKSNLRKGIYQVRSEGTNLNFEFRYTGIRTRNLDRSIDFYAGALGTRLVSRLKTPIGEFAVLRSGDSRHNLEINYYPDNSPEGGFYESGNEIDHLAFKVKDVDETVHFLKERGFLPVFGPETFGDWRVAYVEDPDGIWI